MAEYPWPDPDRREQAELALLETIARTPWPEQCELSPAELRAVHLASHGLTNQQIAEMTAVSLETVKSRLKVVGRKLAAKNRAHAVAKALRSGLIE